MYGGKLMPISLKMDRLKVTNR